jgi:LemA protein
MKRSWTIIGIVTGAVLLLALIFAGSYNELVQSRETVRSSINNLQSQYQRRADLVPNLVATVKGAANFEQTTLTEVVEARAKATQTTIDPSTTTPEQLQQYQAAQGELSQALGRLLVVVEAYPELKATEAFRDLTTQLEGTENRIQVARSDYGKAVQVYNAKIQRFPTNITAALFGFEAFPYFNADQGAEQAPSVDFNTSEPTNEQ